MGIGVIIRDESGFVMAAKSKTILAIFEPATREALVALHIAVIQDLNFYRLCWKGTLCWLSRPLGRQSKTGYDIGKLWKTPRWF